MRQQLSCIGEISAPVHGRRPRDDTGEWADGGRRREVRREQRNVGLQAQQSDPQQTREHRRLMITGDTPYLPRWLVAELLQLSTVLV
jgi:hypothetical protein